MSMADFGDRVAGVVSLVGAGPGDPELLTLRAWRRLQDAEVVCYDHLVGDSILGLIPMTARRICVGKTGGGASTPQEEIEAVLIREARAGRRVVRLKGGDPFVFGRGGEEVLALSRAGIPVEVVPGISSAVAGPSAAGIPVTHRGVSTSVTVVTGACARGAERALRESWVHLARAGGTLVVLMSLGRLEAILDALREAGLAAGMPAAMVQSATLEEQRVVVGTVGDLGPRVRAAGLTSPALLVVGDVVGLRAEMTTLLSLVGQSAREAHEPPRGNGEAWLSRSDAAAAHGVSGHVLPWSAEGRNP